MKDIYLIRILVPFLVNYSVLVKSEQSEQQEAVNASCNVGNDNFTIIEPNHFLNPVEYGDLRNYIPGLVSQIASLAIQGVTNDKTQIVPPKKEIETHVEALNRIKKTIDIPPLRNNLIIIGKSDDSRVRFMANCDNTESQHIFASTESTSEKKQILRQETANARNVKVQFDIPVDIKVLFNMEVQNGTGKLKNSEFEENKSDYPYKFSKPCGYDKGQNCCNLTCTDDKIKPCQKCMCCNTPNKKCDCCSLNNNNNSPSNEVGHDDNLVKSKISDLPSKSEPEFMKNSFENMIKQDGSSKKDEIGLIKVGKRSYLPSNRNNIIIIGKDDVHVNTMSMPTSTVRDGIFPSMEGLVNESSCGQSNSVKLRLDVPMDSKLFFNITVANGKPNYDKFEASFSDPDCVYPKLNLAALKSVLESYKTKNHTNNTSQNSISLTPRTFMKKENTTTIYSQDSSTHRIQDKNLEESTTVKGQIDSVTSPLKKKIRKKFRKMNKCYGKAVTKKNIEKESSVG
ncbi:hypothetical protein LSTR_LSTR005384 [Laodelphax striatellus]|uniref:Uncharacterized protein n=1 Tax=Laodelphax striatellus TaxID=195883 RepID=A0A482WS18_LAOST|nr:hypothetical protein LSTR_LSTR005384 [Laodelphax striatellus]